TVKKSAKVIIERYYPKLTLDFETNKRICDEIAIIASKRLRNKIAGYTTHLMKRIQRGPVRGISFKLQEEERERKDQYVPEVSALDFTQNSESGMLDVDQDTKDLLKSLGFDAINVNVVPVAQQQVAERPRRFGDRLPATKLFALLCDGFGKVLDNHKRRVHSTWRISLVQVRLPFECNLLSPCTTRCR
ncbi:unnamed protein product, partial [Aureobasidium pullulans]